LHGIYSFALAFTLSIALLSIALMTANTKTKMLEAETTAIEIEKGNFLRKMLEENIDLIISETIETQIKKKNFDPEKINSSIAQRLAEYFKKTETQFSGEPRIEFFLIEEKNLLNGSPKKEEFTELQGIEKLFKTITININENAFFIECAFTGGEHSKAIVGKIHSKNAKTYFLIPIGYKVKKMVIA